jgi:hypothetical protein
VLSGSGLCNQTGFAQPFSQQSLTENIVDLVASGVVKVFALEEDPRATTVLSKPMGFSNDGRAARVSAVKFSELVGEGRICFSGGVGSFQLVQGVNK